MFSCIQSWHWESPHIHTGPYQRTTMHDWLIDGLKVGYYHEASLLNEQHGFEDLHTLPGKMVRRFDIDIEVEMISDGQLFV